MIQLIKSLRIEKIKGATFSAEQVGKLIFTKNSDANGVYVTCTNERSKLTQKVYVDDVIGADNSITFSVSFDTFGIEIFGVTDLENLGLAPGTPAILTTSGTLSIPAVGDPGQPLIAPHAYIPAVGATPAIPATSGIAGQPYVAPTPAVNESAAYLQVNFTGVQPTGTDLTGLPPVPTGADPATYYYADVTVDSVVRRVYVRPDLVPTFDDLITWLNSSWAQGGPNTGMPFRFSFGTIQLLTSTLNNNANVNISNDNLFRYLTGFGGIGAPQPYVAARPANPGQPYIAAVAGTPYVPAKTGTPEIRATLGQPYIAPSADYKPAVQATSGQSLTITNTLFNTPEKRINVIADNICNSTNDIVLRAIIPVDVNIPFGIATLPAKADANLSYGDYQGWVLYREPNADELATDSNSPNNTWQPYFGDFSPMPRLTSTVIPAIKLDRASPLTLPNGTIANKFDYIWNDYAPVSDVFMQKKFIDVVNPLMPSPSLQFVVPNEKTLSPTRLNVYLNGIYQDAKNYSVLKNTVSCDGLNPNLGDMITVIYKAYTPSQDELKFDPDHNPGTDNPVQLLQYKYDYQYTVREIRDSYGALIQTKYYFWVKNKNLTSKGRALSLSSAKNLLKSNTNPYAILQSVSTTTDTANKTVPSYNQFIGVGLNRFINEDNTYKIRFTRDFVLRDDPKDIELKNVHTEWAMIREQQSTKIPEQLWNILVDAACGQNIIGDAVPSFARIAYDERNGTTSRFGFGDGQTFVEKSLAVNSIKYAILNTSLTTISPASPGVEFPNPIEFIDPAKVDEMFSTPANIRKTMNDIWTMAQPKQINEILFTVLYDALSENYEFSDIFKTSMIAAHSIRFFSSLGQ
jgi:hypothetical protein